MIRTNHLREIAFLHFLADRSLGDERISLRLAAELLEAHDDTGISLDDWPTARRFVEGHLGSPISPNAV